MAKQALLDYNLLPIMAKTMVYSRKRLLSQVRQGAQDIGNEIRANHHMKSTGVNVSYFYQTKQNRQIDAHRLPLYQCSRACMTTLPSLSTIRGLDNVLNPSVTSGDVNIPLLQQPCISLHHPAPISCNRRRFHGAVSNYPTLQRPILFINVPALIACNFDESASFASESVSADADFRVYM